MCAGLLLRASSDMRRLPCGLTPRFTSNPALLASRPNPQYTGQGRHQQLADFEEHLEDLRRDWFNVGLLQDGQC